MKYLKKYNESISENELRDMINDIVLDLQDNNFTIRFFKDNEYGDDDYKIHIGTNDDKKFYKWIDVKYPILHLLDFAKDNGYFWSVKYYKPLRRPQHGKVPKNIGSGRHTFTSSGFDKIPDDDDYFCTSNQSNGMKNGLDIIISLLGKR